MVKRVDIKFRKVKILGYNRYENSYDLLVTFGVNDGVSRVSRNYVIGKAEDVIVDVVNFIKGEVREGHKSEAGEGDILSGHVIINFDNLEVFEKKMMMFIKKFYDCVHMFRTDKSADGYMDRFFSLKGAEIEF